MALPFVKLDASGNDFVLVDARGRASGGGPDWAVVARDVCRRRRSVGADGLVVVSGPARALRVAHLEPDGARTFCLNALRGVVAWALGEGLPARRLVSDVGDHAARVAGPGRVAVALAPPRAVRRVVVPTHGVLAAAEVAATFVDVGNPQLVVPLDDPALLEHPRLMDWGRALRHDPARAGGTNVDFVVRAADGALRVRTFERGVEAETLSCGSGIVASAWALAAPGERVVVHTRGGEVQGVTLDAGRVWSEGPARVVARGAVDLEEAAWAGRLAA